LRDQEFVVNAIGDGGAPGGCVGFNEIFGRVGDVGGLHADGSTMKEAGAAGMPPQQIEYERRAHAHAGGRGSEGQTR
jgi:hypothetical protein